MCPTIVARDGKPILITGSPGGRTIINTVLCVVLNRIEFNMRPEACVAAPRHHHQWFPDRIQIEPLPELSKDRILTALKNMGHTIDPTPKPQGDAHSIFYDDKTTSWTAVSDQRRSGSAAGF
jgi:gamma-glutamyltranspeptidase/glutathione hydrolase